MSLINGFHHVALKCASEEKFEETIRFYCDVLGMTVVRNWGEGAGRGIMISTGGGLMEIFAEGCAGERTGSVNHFALATQDVDACLKAVREAGYEITMEPTDICIPSETAFPARIAFCIGPVGEEIEFFCEK